MSLNISMMSASRTARELQKYLSIPTKPYTLRTLHKLKKTDRQSILSYTHELAVRTARCYAAFSDPVVKECLANVPRLRWAKETSLWEFQFCVELQEAAIQYASANGPSHSTSNKFCLEYLYEGLPSSGQLEKKNLKAPCPTRGDTFSPISRDKIVQALQKGEVTIQSLPFETVLALLRPDRSLLDLLVGDSHIDYLPLNMWYSKFCQRRCGWRVLHEHLLHVLEPHAFPHVVEENLDVLQQAFYAAEVVLEIHACRPLIHENEQLCIRGMMDSSILHHRPSAPLLSVSNSPQLSSSATPLASAKDNNSQVAPQTSTIYGVDSHLKYVFRELLKNAYAAAVVEKAHVELQMRAAFDNEWVTVDMEDNGHGIDPRYENDIWRFGFSTKDDSGSILGGYGVGIPTSKVYMDLWGGYIEAYSSNMGSVMRVRFPKAPTEHLAEDNVNYWPTSGVEV